jgi:hypothetical protein
MNILEAVCLGRGGRGPKGVGAKCINCNVMFALLHFGFEFILAKPVFK